jgi:hypothetical protein
VVVPSRRRLQPRIRLLAIQRRHADRAELLWAKEEELEALVAMQ